MPCTPAAFNLPEEKEVRAQIGEEGKREAGSSRVSRNNRSSSDLNSCSSIRSNLSRSNSSSGNLGSSISTVAVGAELQWLSPNGVGMPRPADGLGTPQFSRRSGLVARFPFLR